jgi:hypothetical protein
MVMKHGTVLLEVATKSTGALDFIPRRRMQEMTGDLL